VSDIDGSHLPETDTKGREYRVLDAMDLTGPLSGRKFDLIFSSNMMEHVEDPVVSLRGMLGLLEPRHGVMVHIMPNKVWKALQIGLSVPDAAFRTAKRVVSGRSEPVTDGAVSNHVSRSRSKRISEVFWPAPHGVSSGNLKEFGDFGRASWLRRFDEAGVRIVRVEKLYAHSPYRWGWEKVRGIVTAAGIVSSLVYIGVHPEFEGNPHLNEWLGLNG
jgi:hypothetical protein